jgi:hypothetical protein
MDAGWMIEFDTLWNLQAKDGMFLSMVEGCCQCQICAKHTDRGGRYEGKIEQEAEKERKRLAASAQRAHAAQRVLVMRLS